jgi:hypothetical protein
MTDRYPTPPKNLMEFAHCFATDERCAEYLFELRHPDGYVCPKCGSTKAWSVAEKPGMMICCRRRCESGAKQPGEKRTGG